MTVPRRVSSVVPRACLHRSHQPFLVCPADEKNRLASLCGRWSCKFEGNEVPAAFEEAANDAARERLQRRPSWAAKFEGAEETVSPATLT